MSGNSKYSPENCSIDWGDVKLDQGHSPDSVILFEDRPKKYLLKDKGDGVFQVVSDTLTLEIKEGSLLHRMLLEDEGKSEVKCRDVDGEFHIKFGE
mgnify:FL=1